MSATRVHSLRGCRRGGRRQGSGRTEPNPDVSAQTSVRLTSVQVIHENQAQTRLEVLEAVNGVVSVPILR